MSVDASFGATTVGEHLLAFARSGGNAAKRREYVRAKCKHGRERMFVSIMTAALKRAHVNIEETDFDAASELLKASAATGLTKGKDCFEEELRGLKKLKDSLGPTRSMPPAEFEKKFLELHDDTDTALVAANLKKLASV